MTWCYSRPLIPSPSPRWGEGSGLVPLHPLIPDPSPRGEKGVTWCYSRPLIPGPSPRWGEGSGLVLLPPPHPRPFSPVGRREWLGATSAPSSPALLPDGGKGVFPSPHRGEGLGVRGRSAHLIKPLPDKITYCINTFSLAIPN
ncbi:MAG: hypothetical protein K0S08_1637 [Gammaproteobacteria bacterium]|nr:hypothetical protein [Gammaproteobacteria bacterium]